MKYKLVATLSLLLFSLSVLVMPAQASKVITSQSGSYGLLSRIPAPRPIDCTVNPLTCKPLPIRSF